MDLYEWPKYIATVAFGGIGIGFAGYGLYEFFKFLDRAIDRYFDRQEEALKTRVSQDTL